jgi:hypothetical protein
MLHVTRFYIFIRISTRNARKHALFCTESPNLALGYIGRVVKNVWSRVAQLKPTRGAQNTCLRLAHVNTYIEIREGGNGLTRRLLLEKR